MIQGDPTTRAITAFSRTQAHQQPATGLSGPAKAGGHNFIVLRNLGGVLAVYRVLPHSGALKRLKRWPKEVE